MLFSYKTESAHFARLKTNGLVKIVTPLSLHLSGYHFFYRAISCLKK